MVQQENAEGQPTSQFEIKFTAEPDLRRQNIFIQPFHHLPPYIIQSLGNHY